MSTWFSDSELSTCLSTNLQLLRVNVIKGTFANRKYSIKGNGMKNKPIKKSVIIPIRLKVGHTC